MSYINNSKKKIDMVIAVNNTEAKYFEKRLQEVIEVKQKDECEIEIQYQTSHLREGEVNYSALVICRK